MRNQLLLVSIIVVLIGVSSCSKTEETVKKETSIVVAVPRHPYSFNPLIAKNPEGKMIATLVYPGLYHREYDVKKKAVVYKTQVASWSEAFGSYVMMRIKPGAMWSDDIPVNAKDILYSYQLYANEELGSIWRSYLNGLKTDANGNIDIAAAVQIDDDSTVTFNFVNDSSVNYAVFTVPILPRHQMDALPAIQLKASIPTKTPTIAGPFLVAGLNEQEFVLKPNPASTIPKPAGVDKIIFRVVPGTKAKVEAFKAGQLDIADDLSAAEIAEITEVRDDVETITFPPLRYHVIGWNNLDGEAYRSSNGEKIKANRLFGTAKLRRAMTLAINREKIVTSIIGKEVTKAFGPVSPLFTQEYHDTLHQMYCDPAEAKMILTRDLWQDLTRSGTVEKFNKPFAFDLKVSADDEKGKLIAEEVKKQLKEIGIDVTVAPVDPKLFPQVLREKDFDAFIGAVDIPHELSLRNDWSMHLEEADRNFVSFRNKRVTEILDSTGMPIAQAEKVRMWKEFQDIIQLEQPYSFLYWESRYAVKSSKVKGVVFSPDGFMSSPWNWKVTE